MRISFRLAAPFAALTCLLTLALSLAGCGGNASGSGGAASRASGSDGVPAGSLLPDSLGSDVLGVLNGEELTLDDLDEDDRWQLAQLRSDYYTAAHDLLAQAALRAARTKLLEAEAMEKGLTLSQYTIEEIGIPEVSDETVEAVYEQNREALGGRPLEEIQSDLRRQIANQELGQKIAMAGQQFLLQSEWELRVRPYRFEIETAGHAALGPEDAPVELVVFSDFECPFCRRFNGTLDQLREDADYEDKVRVVFRHFPIRSIHPLAQKAAEASICAEDQGKFWEFHDALWADTNLNRDNLEQHALLLGLDTEAFGECLRSGRHYDRVQADLDAAKDLGQTGTPAVFVNGRHMRGGAVPFQQLMMEIDRDLAESN